MTTQQSAKASARKAAKEASKPDPDVAQQALEDAQNNQRRMPAQKLTANLLPETKGEVVHHPKEIIISEFDDPDANKVR